MTFIPIPRGVQLCFDFATASQFWQFCLSLQKRTGNPTTTDLDDINTAAAAWWNASMKAGQSNTTTLRQVRATDMTSQGAPQHILTVGTAGTGGSDFIPSGTAIVVSQRTLKRGRSYRGRAYYGGVTGSVLDTPTELDAGTASGIAVAFGDLADDIDALGFDVVVASRQHNGVVTNPAEVNKVEEYLVDTHLDSQRRRLAGRGT